MDTNDIPFASIRRQDAEKEPMSPYAEFCTAMMTITVVEITSGRKWTKGELFCRYATNSKALKAIMDKVHPDFEFNQQ